MKQNLIIFGKSHIKEIKTQTLKNKDEYKEYIYNNIQKIRENTHFGKFKIISIEDLFDYKILIQGLQNTNGMFLFSDFYDNELVLKVFNLKNFLFLEINVQKRGHKVYRFFDKNDLSYIGRFETINYGQYFGNVYIDNEDYKRKGIMSSIISDFIVKAYSKINQGTAVSDEMYGFLRKMEMKGYFTFKEEGSTLGYYHEKK